jgi:hypothetical protein
MRLFLVHVFRNQSPLAQTGKIVQSSDDMGLRLGLSWESQQRRQHQTLIRRSGFRVVGRFEKFPSEPAAPLEERILAVWPENDVYWGFNWGRSPKLAEVRIFFTDKRVVMIGLVGILSPGFVGTTLGVQAAELERKRQNEQMRTATLDGLLSSDPRNMQVSYEQVAEISCDEKYFRIKFGSSIARVQPVKSGGFLAYAHPDAVPDPAQLMKQTIEALSDVPALAGKIVVRP